MPWTSVRRRALLAVPVLAVVWLGWSRRWTSDDAFINFRILRQLQHGNGLVVNVGDRIEAGTSPLWIAILTVADFVLPVRLEWIALLLGLLATAAGVALAIAAGARTSRLTHGAGLLLPLGALVYVVLPPAWDFATSGLENGLGILWLGACWYVLSGWATDAGDTPVHPPVQRSVWAAGLLVGLGPFVRPDFAIFTVAWLVAMVLLGPRTWRAGLRVAGWVLVLPVVGEIARLAYFGLPVPATAIAKEASRSYLRQGAKYAWDLVMPYGLFVPVALLALVFLWPSLRREGGAMRPWRMLTIVTVAGAAVHALYIVRVGGDFMHGRMLLAPLFVGLLPVAVVPWGETTTRRAAAVAIAAWAVTTAVALRTDAARPVSGDLETQLNAARGTRYVADERLYYVRYTGHAHPITLEDHLVGKTGEVLLRVREFVAAGGTGLLLLEDDPNITAPLPLNAETRAVTDVVAYFGPLGVLSYGLPRDAWVMDRPGLAYATASHVYLAARGRPGHEKRIPLAWVIAQFGSADAPLPAGVAADDVAAARRALSCGGFAEVADAATDQLTAGQMVDNITGAWSRWRFRFDADPMVAAAEACGD